VTVSKDKRIPNARKLEQCGKQSPMQYAGGGRVAAGFSGRRRTAEAMSNIIGASKTGEEPMSVGRQARRLGCFGPCRGMIQWDCCPIEQRTGMSRPESLSDSTWDSDKGES